MPDIVIVDVGYASYKFEEDLFRKHGYRLKIFNGDAADIESKMNFSSGASGILVRGTKIDKKFLERMKQLRAIVRYGTGYDNIDLEEATRRGIKVANVQGYANHAVSDHAMALMFACIRGVPSGMKQIRERFGKPPFSEVFELHEKTLGIIGLGKIGSHFCEKSKHLFREVLAVDPYIPDERFTRFGAGRTSLEDVLQRSHVISVHCSLTDETKNVLNSRTFSLMRMKPVLVNTARGPVLNEQDLLEALDKGQLHSAGLDVFVDEPTTLRQDKLINHPRVVVTGHYAWYSESSVPELQKRAANNMIKLLQGEEVEDQLN